MGATAVIPTNGLLKQLSQHPVLPLLVASPAFRVEPPPALRDRMEEPKRLSAYLFFYMVEGETTHDVDLRTVELRGGQVLWIQPNQIHRILGGWPEARLWYKMAFDEECLSRLPRHFDFLDDPLGMGMLPASPRLGSCFEGLIEVLGGAETSASVPASPRASASVELVLAYMNVLLTEMNEAYFRGVSAIGPVGGEVDVFLRFKRLVEDWFSEQPSVQRLAGELGVSESRLYAVVSRLSGVSPKAFVTRRTMLEAQRLFYYDRPSVKEVAYRLGFSDPDHFSRVFKRVVGRTVKDFLAGLGDVGGAGFIQTLK